MKLLLMMVFQFIRKFIINEKISSIIKNVKLSTNQQKYHYEYVFVVSNILHRLKVGFEVVREVSEL